VFEYLEEFNTGIFKIHLGHVRGPVRLVPETSSDEKSNASVLVPVNVALFWKLRFSQFQNVTQDCSILAGTTRNCPIFSAP
jgi:hypothetical protein